MNHILLIYNEKDQNILLMLFLFRANKDRIKRNNFNN